MNITRLQNQNSINLLLLVLLCYPKRMHVTRATGNSRFEMTKFPPANGKIPENSRFPNWQYLWVYAAQKSYQTSLQAYIANVNDVEESLRPILESRREWNRSIPGCQTRCLILFVLCAPGECSSWEYLGLLGPILFLIYMDDIQQSLGLGWVLSRLLVRVSVKTGCTDMEFFPIWDNRQSTAEDNRQLV